MECRVGASADGAQPIGADSQAVWAGFGFGRTDRAGLASGTPRSRTTTASPAATRQGRAHPLVLQCEGGCGGGDKRTLSWIRQEPFVFLPVTPGGGRATDARRAIGVLAAPPPGCAEPTFLLPHETLVLSMRTEDGTGPTCSRC